MFLDMVQLANQNSWKIFLYGSVGDTNELAKKKLRYKYRKIKIETSSAPMYDLSGKPKSEEDKKLESNAVKKINKFNPHLLFVGIQPPKQEKILDRLWDELDIGGAMVVGGAFDHVAGVVKSPPEFVEKMEIEWAWRMVTQLGRSRNFRRIINSVVVFPWRVFMFKFNLKSAK
jgi:N-acetylglucosaminyldiphosphoundecaprenol N-acetyl-beta-D-mannosaminyltransferase